MSGPKLVGITCDPVVIARNNERLKAVGKEEYYRNIFTDLNTDIQNVETWIKNYAKSTVTKIPNDYGDPIGILHKMDKLKEEHIAKVESEKIRMSIIKKMSPEKLNKYGMNKVQAIPKWKDTFIAEISILLRKLQVDVSNYENGIRQQEFANKEYEKKLREVEKSSESISKFMQGKEIDAMHVGGYSGVSKNIPFAPEIQKKKEELQDMPYAFDELALIEMFQMDLLEFEGCPYLSDTEMNMIEKFNRDLLDVSDGNAKYPMKSKRAILNRMRMNYQSLSRQVSELVAAHNAEEEKKSILIIEYTSFCRALEKECDNYEEWSVAKLQETVNHLRAEVEKQEERIYVEETIEEIMDTYGYSSISSHNLHEADRTSQIIFEDEDGAKISTSFGDGMVLMHVVGEGESEPTDGEIAEQVKQQEAFCTLYPKIRNELKQKGINILSESLTPVSEKYVSNIKIDRQKNIKKSTSRFSFRHIPSVSDTSQETFDYEETGNKLYNTLQEE